MPIETPVRTAAFCQGRVTGDRGVAGSAARPPLPAAVGAACVLARCQGDIPRCSYAWGEAPREKTLLASWSSYLFSIFLGLQLYQPQDLAQLVIVTGLQYSTHLRNKAGISQADIYQKEKNPIAFLLKLV